MTGFQAIGADPYFLQAYNSPNYYQLMQTQQAQQAQQASQTGAVAGVQNPTSQVQQTPTFKGAQEDTTKSSGTNWGALGLTLLTTGIGACWWFASKGKAAGAEGLWKQIKTGATSVYNSSKDFFVNLFAKK